MKTENRFGKALKRVGLFGALYKNGEIFSVLKIFLLINDLIGFMDFLFLNLHSIMMFRKTEGKRPFDLSIIIVSA